MLTAVCTVLAPHGTNCRRLCKAGRRRSRLTRVFGDTYTRPPPLCFPRGPTRVYRHRTIQFATGCQPRGVRALGAGHRSPGRQRPAVRVELRGTQGERPARWWCHALPVHRDSAPARSGRAGSRPRDRSDEAGGSRIPGIRRPTALYKYRGSVIAVVSNRDQSLAVARILPGSHAEAVSPRHITRITALARRP